MTEEDKSKLEGLGFWAQARERAKRQAQRVSERIAANAADLAGAASEATRSIQESEVFERVRQATESARARLEAAATDVQERAQEAGETARIVITTLASAADDLQEEDALTMHFKKALEPLASQLDRQANAVAIGYLAQRGIGISEVTGTEIFYVRPDGPVRAQLRVNSMSGRTARLALGASTGAYVSCLYGPRDALSRPTQRRGGDVGVLVASIGFFRATAAGDRVARGWMVSLSAGLGLGIPILSDLTAFELDEHLQGGFSLDKSASEDIEAIIQQAPDRLRRRQLTMSL